MKKLFIVLFVLCYANLSYGNEWPILVGATNTVRTRNSKKEDIILPQVIQKIKLEDVSLKVKNGEKPDTFMRFSPNGNLIAIGTFLGHIKMVEVYTGKMLWDKKVAEGMVKKIDFSPDGKRVYFGEQSIDGFIYAAQTKTGDILWKFRLADDLETSAPYDENDIYKIYTLPGCYKLKVLDDGDILVLGIHSWGDTKKKQSRTRLSRVYRFSPEGKIRWAFPQNGPMPMSLIYMDADLGANRVAILADTLGENAPENFPYKQGSLLVLEGNTGNLHGSYVFKPIEPFKKIGFWQSISVGPEGKLASIGMHDGRTFLFDLDTVLPKKVFNFGAPIMISNVPVSASATYTHLSSDEIAYFQTGNSSIANASGRMRHAVPPGPHPFANMINAVDMTGQVKWRYRSGHHYQNFWTSQDGRWLVTCVSRGGQDEGSDAGAMLFDTHRKGGGTSKFVYFYQIEGMVFFHADMTKDGSAFAIAEIPYKDQSGQLVGTYQVHIVR